MSWLVLLCLILIAIGVCAAICAPIERRWKTGPAAHRTYRGLPEIDLPDLRARRALQAYRANERAYKGLRA